MSILSIDNTDPDLRYLTSIEIIDWERTTIVFLLFQVDMCANGFDFKLFEKIMIIVFTVDDYRITIKNEAYVYIYFNQRRIVSFNFFT